MEQALPYRTLYIYYWWFMVLVNLQDVWGNTRRLCYSVPTAIATSSGGRYPYYSADGNESFYLGRTTPMLEVYMPFLK